jgi:hypothetical protein
MPPTREEEDVTPILLGGEDTDPFRAPNFYVATAYALAIWGLIAVAVFVPWAWMAVVALIVVAVVAIRRHPPLS